MPRRTDIRSILIIGSGPIVIGQGCEFDYSGVQACRALREEGYRIVLINSNPATIMTDPEFADATYIEPITPEAVEKILEREKQQGTPIDALLPTLGGQTGLNTGMACFDRGILTKYNVKMIGADRDAIHRGEDRQVFKDLMIQIGLKVPRSGVVHNIEDARKVLADIGLPLIIRPAFTLGGTGGGIAYNVEEFERIVQGGLDASPVTEVLVEQSVIGWKEYEMEVMRDKNDNVVIICSIENLDAMGVHTGDSITVAPIQTLTDKEYQRMRDASIAVIRAVGVETGGSNIQFGIDPANGDMVVIEMNPRVSRSSALASKATGYPIAKLAAKLAVGYTLDELPNYITSCKRVMPATHNPNPNVSAPEKNLSAPAPKGLDARNNVSAPEKNSLDARKNSSAPAPNDLDARKNVSALEKNFLDARPNLSAPEKNLSGSALNASISAPNSDSTVREQYETWTSACFEPTIDYCVIKIPRWTFEKFPDADETLTTQMKSVGEAMAIGRTFKEALQKGIRSMEVKRFGFGLDKYDKWLNAQQGKANDTKAEASTDKTTQGESLDQEWPIPEDKLRRKLAVPSQGRLYYIRYALKMGWTLEQVHELTKYDPWFLGQMKELVDFESVLMTARDEELPSMDYTAMLRQAKAWGYSDVQLENIFNSYPPEGGRWMRDINRVYPVYKLVDTCAAEFEAATPYYYSTYETPFTVNGKAVHEDEIRLTDRPKIIIIGGGPNRIGQGIEFDYCCVQAAFAMRELGIESVMINSNPETVSTDYDTSDLLFFEPLTHEDVLNICERLNGVAFNEVPEIDFVDGAEPADAVHVTTLRNYLRRERLGRVAILSVSSKSREESHRDVDGPSVVYDMIDDRGEFWHMTIADRSPDSIWGSCDGPSSYPSTLDQKAIRERFAGKLKPTKKGLVEGVVVQYGGQTPLNLARGLMDAGVPILGTPVDSLDKAGDREQFRTLLEDLELKQPPNGIARNVEEARKIAREIGYPVLVRPSFVLGGRAMEIVSDEGQLNYYMANAIDANAIADAPILVDKFLDNATECDVDCIADFEPRRMWPQIPVEARTPEQKADHWHRAYGTAGLDGSRRQAIVIGVMEHIEEAGIHSGDSACTLPPYSLSPEIIAELKRQTKELARALHVKGLMNVQYAIKDGEIYVIEVNPRASRTVPFVGKATGIPWAKVAAKVMAGKTLDELGVTEQPDPKHVSVKEAVFPFSKFLGVDVILGPEMRSTGEVMGIDRDFPLAFAKAQIAAGTVLPTKGTVYISVRDGDKDAIVPVAKAFADAGFEIIATGGTYTRLSKSDIPATRISKLAEGRPNIKDFIKNGKVHLIINTPTRKGPTTDEGQIRSMAVLNKIPIVTTITGANAAVKAIAAMQKEAWGVRPLQEYFTKV